MIATARKRESRISIANQLLVLRRIPHRSESNFGKRIPHFKQWNQLVVWDLPPPIATGMDQWYGRVNGARLNSPALISRNRYSPSLDGGRRQRTDFCSGEVRTGGRLPADHDVVLAFANLLRHGQSPPLQRCALT